MRRIRFFEILPGGLLALVCACTPVQLPPEALTATGGTPRPLAATATPVPLDFPTPYPRLSPSPPASEAPPPAPTAPPSLAALLPPVTALARDLTAPRAVVSSQPLVLPTGVITTATPPVGTATVAPTAAPVVAPVVPTAPPTPISVGPALHEGGVVFVKPNPFGFPTSTAIGRPEALGGKASYQLMAADAPTPAQIVLVSVLPYFATTILMDAVLAAAAKAQLEPDRDYVFPDEHKPGKFLTVRLEVKSDHALLSVWRGQAATPGQQFAGIRWSNARQGQAVFRTLPGDGDENPQAFSTTFDQVAGLASCEQLYEERANQGQKTFAHLEIRSFPGGSPRFGLRSAATLYKPGEAAQPGRLAVAANYLDDGRGALWIAVGNRDTGDKALFWPVNDKDFGKTPPGEHDFYVDRQGRDLARLLAGPLLKQALPADGELPTSYPPDPSVGSPFADPRFDFPS